MILFPIFRLNTEKRGHILLDLTIVALAAQLTVFSLIANWVAPKQMVANAAAGCTLGSKGCVALDEILPSPYSGRRI